MAAISSRDSSIIAGSFDDPAEAPHNAPAIAPMVSTSPRQAIVNAIISSNDSLRCRIAMYVAVGPDVCAETPFPSREATSLGLGRAFESIHDAAKASRSRISGVDAVAIRRPNNSRRFQRDEESTWLPWQSSSQHRDANRVRECVTTDDSLADCSNSPRHS